MIRAVNAEGLGDDFLGTVMRGSRLATGSWKTSCVSRRNGLMSCWASMGLPSHTTWPPDALHELQGRASERRFSRARFAHDAHRFAGFDVQVDAVDGAQHRRLLEQRRRALGSGPADWRAPIAAPAFARFLRRRSRRGASAQPRRSRGRLISGPVYAAFSGRLSTRSTATRLRQFGRLALRARDRPCVATTPRSWVIRTTGESAVRVSVRRGARGFAPGS